MRIFLIAAAGLEAVLVALWIGSFVVSGVIGTDHQFWYVELPLVFVALPAGLATAVVLMGNRTDGRRDWAFPLGGLALVANLLAFIGYAAMSGGGV
jgi:hypothetical protein